MKADRLISLLLLLQSRRQCSARVLAQTLEVSERTIFRDVEALAAAGVPVFAERAKVVLSGELKKAVTLKGIGATKGARAAIEAAGGKIEATEAAPVAKGKLAPKNKAKA